MRQTAIALAFGLALVLGSAAGAEIYRWTDGRGTPCFAGSLEGVPLEYRERVGVEKPAARARIQLYASEPKAPRPASEGEESRILFQRDGNLMKVNVRLNDHVVAPFYVDTAASYVTLTEEVAEQLGLTRDGSRWTTAATANGPTRLSVVDLDSVELGRSRVTNVRGLVNPRLDVGLLGAAFFNHFNYSVDTLEGVIALRPNRR